MNIYGVTGWKNSGKTTLVEKLVTEIVRQGFTVSTIKHAHHHFDIDQPGKDSWRHRMAGASEVLVSSDARWALMHELRDSAEPDLDILLSKLSPVDLVLVEGYKYKEHPKIEANRPETNQALLAIEDPSIQAVASTSSAAFLREHYPLLNKPVFDLNNISAIAGFILTQTGLHNKP